jgi:hypothetical protein
MSAARAEALRIPANVIAREVDGETVIVDLTSGNCFGLDRVGTRVWQLVGERGSVDQVLDAMLAEFDVDEERLRRDLDELLAELRSRGLLEAA